MRRRARAFAMAAIAVVVPGIAASCFGQPASDPGERSIFEGLPAAARARYEAAAMPLQAGASAAGCRGAGAACLYPVQPARDGRADGVVLVLPGGGYRYHAASEAFPIAELFRDAGLAAFVLQYRLLPDHDPERDALADALRAVRLLRSRARDLEIDPARVAAIGFSAGGHLAANLSLHGDDGVAQAGDAVERQPSRISTALLIYPGILSARRAPGGGRSTAALLQEQGLHRLVDARTPPTFLVVGYDDTRTPYEGCLAYAARLHEAAVRLELHVFGHGGHGGAIRDGRRAEWTAMALAWLRTLGIAPPP